MQKTEKYVTILDLSEATKGFARKIFSGFDVHVP